MLKLAQLKGLHTHMQRKIRSIHPVIILVCSACFVVVVVMSWNQGKSRDFNANPWESRGIKENEWKMKESDGDIPIKPM